MSRSFIYCKLFYADKRVSRSLCYSRASFSVYVSVDSHISKTTYDQLHLISSACCRGRGSVLLWRRCGTLCICVLWMTSCFSNYGPSCCTSLPQQRRARTNAAAVASCHRRRRAPRQDEPFVQGVPGAEFALHRCPICDTVSFGLFVHVCCCCVKLAFHDADTDTDILATI